MFYKSSTKVKEVESVYQYPPPPPPGYNHNDDAAAATAHLIIDQDVQAFFNSKMLALYKHLFAQRIYLPFDITHKISSCVLSLNSSQESVI